MRKGTVVILLCLSVIAEIIICVFFMQSLGDISQDTVAVNRCLKSVESACTGAAGPDADQHLKDIFTDKAVVEKLDDSLAFSVMDMSGNVLYSNDPKAAKSLNDAVKNHDTILDFSVDGETAGKVLFLNTTVEQLEKYKKNIIICIVISTLIQALILFIYLIYLNRRILIPFERMKAFAVRVASGDLDVPLELDRAHVFGSFTESFDLMRSELKKARLAEKQANDEKKEVIAKLSHDIKTPVASIKSTSEIGYELAKGEREKELFNTVNTKCDQIVTLTDNLFNSSVREITEIDVNPASYPSEDVAGLIRNADYMNRASVPELPACHVYIDKLRLQQAFDNVFMNSYKYADTPIHVTASEDPEYLIITVRDEGEGVPSEELPLLTEKYYRGSNTHEKEGAGLGLHLVNYYLQNMNGYIELASDNGFSVSFYIRKVM